MVKCPKCNENIDFLINVRRLEEDYIFSLKGYELSYQREGLFSEEYWICPNCEEMLFVNEEDAKRFLKGGE